MAKKSRRLGSAQAQNLFRAQPRVRVDKSKHSEAQIVRAAELAKAVGIHRLKVYNVIGLPTETDEDIDELIRFSLELSRILPTSLGVAPFAAKRNTPLDGAPFAVRGVGGLLFKSRMMPKHELSAQWVFDSRPPPRPGAGVRGSEPSLTTSASPPRPQRNEFNEATA